MSVNIFVLQHRRVFIFAVPLGLRSIFETLIYVVLIQVNGFIEKIMRLCIGVIKVMEFINSLFIYTL